ncbi:MAG: biotin/lipoyl-binding protein [Succinivibrio sp.]|nr:biotin/lipoyl-binding protein [Succinivibrio sp.]
MPKPDFAALREQPVFRTIAFFIIVLCAATLLIMLGRRNDAVTLAQIYKAGVLTADEVNVAFENVGGTLIKRYVQESDQVKKGDLLMELDERDLNFSSAALKAQIEALEAQIKQQQLDIDNSLEKLKNEEVRTWRQIEQLSSQIDGAEAAMIQTRHEYQRYEALRKSSSVSQSAYDSARAAYLQAEAQHTSLIKSIQELGLGATAEQVERLKQEHTAEGMTLSSIVEKRADIENERNALSALQASRDALSAQYGQMMLNLSRLKLYAPEDGQVLEVMFEPGELIPASATAVLLQTSRCYYDLYLSEYDAVKYHPGDTVKGYVPALGQSVEGTVRFVQAAPSFADLRMTREQGQADLTSFKVRIYTKALSELIPGMTVELAHD